MIFYNIIMNQKNESGHILDFVITELSKTSDEYDKDTLDFVLKNINIDNITSEELNNLIAKQKNLSKPIFSGSSSSLSITNLNASLRALKANCDLTTSIDRILHFSPIHLGFAKKIFNMQVTQNYLNALKFYFTDELLQKQTAFNVAVEDTINNINNVFNTSSSDMITKVETLDTKFGNLDTKVETLDTKFGNLDTKVETLDTKFGNLDTKVETLDTKFGNLDTKVETLDTKFGNLDTKVETLDTKFGNLDTKVETLDTKFGNLDTKLDQKIDHVNKIMRQLVIDAQLAILSKINESEIIMKKNFDRQILINELSLINDEFSWLNLIDLNKIAYYNNAPKTERFIEYLWIFKNLIKKGKLLDVGCLDSIFAEEISHFNQIDVYGIDTRTSQIRSFKFSIQDVRKMNFNDKFFDQITLISTLEHVGLITYDNVEKDISGDKKAMNEVRRVLKVNGSVLVTIPYGLGNTDWYRSYDKKSITELFSGFKIQQIKYYSDNNIVWNEYDEEFVSKSNNSKQVRGIAAIMAIRKN